MILRTERHDHKEMRSPAAKLAFLAFLLFFFFVIFGTRMPFQERERDVDSITTSNQVRQIVYTILFCAAALALVPRRAHVWRLIRTEKWLTCFLLWCAISILWSEFSFVSLKRYLQVVTSIVVIVAFLLHYQSLALAFKILQGLLGVYLFVCVIAVLMLPGAVDPVEGNWRGLTSNKNLLGQVSFISLLLWINGLRYASPLQRAVALGMMGLAGLVLLGSRSMTALLAAVLTGMITLVEWMAQRLAAVGIGRIFVGWLLVWGLAVMLVVYLEPGAVDSLLGFLGKNATFTDRTALWDVIIGEAKQHWLFGRGFDGFWVVEHETVLMMYETDFVWLPNQGHNGYLDLWNEIGVVGLGLFVGMVFWYFRRARQCAQACDGRWLCLGVLVINLMESTLFRQNTVTGILFMFAYLSVSTELMQTHERLSTPPYDATNTQHHPLPL